MEKSEKPEQMFMLLSDGERTLPWQVACSADGQTVYLICKHPQSDFTKLLKSTDGGNTWKQATPWGSK